MRRHCFSPSLLFCGTVELWLAVRHSRLGATPQTPTWMPVTFQSKRQLCFEQRVVREVEQINSSTSLTLDTRRKPYHGTHRPPVRGLYARRVIAKGEVVAQFSTSECLTGRTAHIYLSQFAPGLEKEIGRVTSAVQEALKEKREEEVWNGGTGSEKTSHSTAGKYSEKENSCRPSRAINLTFADDFPEYSVSRDVVAMVLAVSLIRMQREHVADSSKNPMPYENHPMYKWVSAWPKAIPPFPDVVAQSVKSEDSLVSAVLRNSTQDGIQFKDGSSATEDVAARSYETQLTSIDGRTKMLSEVVLSALADVIALPPNSAVHTPTPTSTVAWAHFMVRSRAARIDATRQGEIGVIPMLDMMNHSNKPNATYSVRTSRTGAAPADTVSISALRKILPGEQLVVNYGDLVQRGLVLGGFDFPAQLELDAPKYASKDLGAQQDEMRFQQISTASNENFVHKEAEEAQRLIMDRHDLWMWTFGFAKSKSEREDDAGFRWSKGVHARSRKLLARTARFGAGGRKGEFLVGVPEGLQHLRAARERLTEYYGKQVHPLTPSEAGLGQVSSLK